MKYILSNRSFLALVASISLTTIARANEWKKETTADGKISVEYRVSQIKNADGEDAPLIEYKALLTDSASFQKCVSTLMNVTNHKKINDDETSETIKKISETEWIVYYNLKIPWPLPKTDCVLRMKFSEDTVKKSAEFALDAAPDQAPSKGKKRFSVHRLSYTIRDLGNGKVELSSFGKSSPPFKLPLWMIRANFPNGASDPLRNIIKLAKAASQSPTN